jgi:hypothetical protein
MKKFVSLLIALIALASDGFAQSKIEEFQASSIEVLSDSAEMLYHKDYLVTVTSGVVGKVGIPNVIRVGDSITVEDTTVPVNYIFVTRCLTRMEYGGQVLCEEGQTTCVAVENPEDVPSDEERDRVWIYVARCKPLG